MLFFSADKRLRRKGNICILASDRGSVDGSTLSRGSTFHFGKEKVEDEGRYVHTYGRGGSGGGDRTERVPMASSSQIFDCNQLSVLMMQYIYYMT